MRLGFLISAILKPHSQVKFLNLIKTDDAEKLLGIIRNNKFTVFSNLQELVGVIKWDFDEIWFSAAETNVKRLGGINSCLTKEGGNYKTNNTTCAIATLLGIISYNTNRIVKEIQKIECQKSGHEMLVRRSFCKL